MARIPVPDIVYQRAVAVGKQRSAEFKAEHGYPGPQGAAQYKALKDAIAADIPQNHELDHFERIDGNLIAVTRLFVPDDPSIPDHLKRKPKR